MGSPIEVEIRASGVAAVQQQLRLVKNEAAEVAAATEGISHSALIGIAELSRGVAKTAEAGHAGAFAMREFTGAAFRLGEYLGPAGPFLPIVGLLGFAFYEVFTGARKQMEETRVKFEQELEQMVNSGNVAALKKQAQDLWVGTPAKGFQDGIAALTKQEAALAATVKAAGTTTANRGGTVQSLADPETIAKLHSVTDALRDLHKQFDTLAQVIENVNNMPLHFDGLGATTITAASNAHQLAEALKEVRERIKEVHAEEKQAEEDRKAALELQKQEGGAIGSSALNERVGLWASGVNSADRMNTLRSGNRRSGRGSSDGIDRDALEEQLSHLSLTGNAFTNTLVKGLNAARASLQGTASDVKSLGDALSSVTTSSVAGFGTASVAALKAFAEHSGNAGKAFKGALGQAVKDTAEQEGQLYAAKALGALGEVFLFGNPGALAAAAEYSAASAAFFALAGGGARLAGSTSASASGGAGGANAATGGSSSSTSIGGSSGQRVTIVLRGPTWRALMTDPQFRGDFVGAMQDLAGDAELDFLVQS